MSNRLHSDREIDGRYELRRLIDEGGMGEVYEAEDRALGRLVALKLLPDHAQDDEVARERLLREGRAGARVQHNNVVRIYEVGCDGETDYVAMELLDGEDLDALIARAGPLSRAMLEYVAHALVDALLAIHGEGIVHRDLKPRNVFLTQEANGARLLKVLDFGVAKSHAWLVDTLTESGQVLGTLQYMSPEQLRGAKYADPRSDIWSVGAVLYEALTGRTPFSAESGPELVLKIATEAPRAPEPRRDDVPEALYALIERCMQRDPAERYQTAAELLQAIRCAFREVPVTRHVGPRGARRWHWLAAAAVSCSAAWWVLYGPLLSGQVVRQPSSPAVKRAAAVPGGSTPVPLSADPAPRALGLPPSPHEPEAAIVEKAPVPFPPPAAARVRTKTGRLPEKKLPPPTAREMQAAPTPVEPPIPIVKVEPSRAGSLQRAEF